MINYESYIDFTDRMTLYGKNIIYESENQLLWTGQLIALLSTQRILKDSTKYRLLRGIDKCKLEPGLYARHPAPYVNTEFYSAISLDEYLGLILAGYFAGDYKMLKDIYRYGLKTNWTYDDANPAVNPVMLIIKNPIIFIKEIFTLLKNGDFKGSLKTDKLIENTKIFKKLARMRLPKDVYYIKLTNHVKPNMLEIFHFYTSIIFSSYKNKKSGHLLSFFKLMLNKDLTSNSITNRIVYNIYYKRMIGYYGTIPNMFKHYYPAGHPFIDLAEVY